MARIVRLAAVSYSPPAHDHHRLGVDLGALREVVLRVARDEPDCICFPEVCACIGGGLAQGVKSAPELEPFAAEHLRGHPKAQRGAPANAEKREKP